MAVADDLNKLAAEDVVYLSRTLRTMNQSSTEVFRGRLRQALNGDWVFNASTGQNGVVGFLLGSNLNNWGSSESPTAGLQVTAIFTVLLATGVPTLSEYIVLTNVIPADFAA